MSNASVEHSIQIVRMEKDEKTALRKRSRTSPQVFLGQAWLDTRLLILS
jgi:glutaredoxin